MKQQHEKRSVLQFNRWGNKSYSAFSSLHRVVKICVLSSAYFVSLGEPIITAQSVEKTAKNIDLEEVNVDADGTATAMESELTRIIATVTQTDIEQSSAESLSQLLESLPGLDIRQRGAQSTQADICIRAGSFDQVLILLNGINITDPQTGHNNLNIPISLNDIDHIEILEGAGLRYNSEGAFAGAINIVTKDVNKTGAEAEIIYGDHNYWNTEVGLTLKQKRFAHRLTASRTTSDGYRDNTDFETKRLFLQSTFKEGNTSADFQLGLLGNGYGSNSFYSAAYPNQYEEVNNIMTSLKISTGNKVKISPKVYYKRGFDHFELFRDMEDAPSWYTSYNYHQTDVWGIGSDFKASTKIGIISLGIDLRNERIRSTVLGENVDSIANPREDDIYFTKEKKRTSYNVFLNHTYYYQNFVVSGNLLFNYNGISEEVKLYPGIDLAYNFTPSLKAKGSINKSFRMPTFTELYYNGSTNIGNADLHQEEALTYDLGIEYATKGFKANASVFYRHGSDIIDWIKADTSQVKWQTMNYSEVNTKGIELSAIVKPGDYVSALSFIKDVRATYTYNHSEVADQEYISYYALDYLKHKFTISGNFNIYKKLECNIMIQNQERCNPTDATSKYEPFWLCDANVRWAGKHVSPYIKVSNVFDKPYYDFNSLPQAGQWTMVGMNISL